MSFSNRICYSKENTSRGKLCGLYLKQKRNVPEKECVDQILLGKGRRQEDKGLTEDEIVGWHHQLNRLESEQTLGDSKRQGSLACCTPWGHKKARHYLETEQQQVLNIEIHPSASFQKFSTT